MHGGTDQGFLAAASRASRRAFPCRHAKNAAFSAHAWHQVVVGLRSQPVWISLKSSMSIENVASVEFSVSTYAITFETEVQLVNVVGSVPLKRVQVVSVSVC